ncbi:MAG: hypothetical protein LBQ75_04245 [Zoogloeaceae bacterium]|jgi:hypothetical protein|nr:hypothetical protein [Zoogloeaceae bacterium]
MNEGHTKEKTAKAAASDIPQLKAMPVRIIPFDLGCPISTQKTSKLGEFINDKNNGVRPLELSGRFNSILSDLCVSFSTISEQDRICYFVFTNGICVCTFQDECQTILDDKAFFAIEYCANRKKSHKEIFDWQHIKSEHIHSTIEGLRKIVHSGEKSLRTSGLNSFENRGMSYVMTLSLFSSPHEQIFDWAHIPQWLKNNITCLLDPEILFLEDSAYFAHSAGENRQTQRKIIESLELTEHRDYDVRRHLSTFISWSAVLVVGNIGEYDIEEYTALEIELQKNWYYIYCIEKMLQSKNGEKSWKIDAVKLRKLKYELENYEDRLHQFEDSSLPSRILQIQEGLLETSGILTNLNRVQRKIDCLIETAAFENQIKQKKFSQTSEILLFIIAYIQIAPIVHEALSESLGSLGTTLGLLAVAIVGAVLLILKDK